MILRRIAVLFAVIVLALACFCLVSGPTQDQSILIIGLYSLAFTAYGFLVNCGSKKQLLVASAISIGVGIRFSLVFLFPNLSDDIYRFIWDGQLIHLGINPLSYTPKELMALGNDDLSSQFSKLYYLLNSPDYYTIYPPVSQLVYYLGVVWESDWLNSSEVMKLILFLAEVVTGILLVLLLKVLGRSSFWAMLYYLNPLIIIEIGGQLHFEGLMIFFFAAFLLLLAKEKYAWAGAMLALSVGTKLLPLMFLPAILNFLRDRQNSVVKFLIGFSSCLALIFVPYFWTLDIGHFLNSLNLYFQKFEFNASIYYLLRGLGKYLTGYNQIAILGPLLSILTLGSILYLSLRESVADLQTLIRIMFWSFAIYLFLATTVHPWYLCLLIFLAALSKQWWVAIWSGVVIWSYSTYASPSFEQNMLLISLEYIIVLVVMGIQYRKVWGIKKA